ncbi:MAG: signal peptide peptidase SppA, partial [Gammaproteobacteria bacterium]
MSSQNLFIRVLGMIWRGLDRLRRILHLIVLLIVFLFVIALATPQRPVVPSAAALVLAPQGVLVDQLSGDPLERALAAAQGLSFGETLLSDVIESVRRAAGDSRIKALVLQLDGLNDAGLSKLQELALEIDRFKESGKPVFAVGSAFDRNQYFLAAHADQILMHPMGLVMIDGYSNYVPYFKSALDKIYVDYNTWTVGDYKSFVEPYTRNDMSPADREARIDYLSAMWDLYQSDVVTARDLEAGSLQRYADEFVSLLRSADGDTSRLAVDYGLVDEAIPFDQIRGRIREVVGADRDDDDGYPSITDRQYLAAMRAVQLPTITNRKIGLVVASGTILDGMQPPGSVGAESLGRLIRKAREDDNMRALVLRIDSPGGSAFASDVILRELEVFRETGRPVVVSMGSVAASGGYWIAMNADEIWASPATLTGSIGVGATFPTFQR